MAVALGVIAGLGHAPIYLPVLTVLAFAIVLSLFAAAPRRGIAVRLIWAFGVGYFAFSLRWIIEPFLVDIDRYGWMAPFAITLMAAGAGAFWALAAWMAARFGRKKPLALAVTLTVAEMARSFILTGFPWALIGHTLIDTPLAHIATFTGPHGLTLLVLLVAVAVVQLAHKLWIPLAAITAISVLWIALDPGPPQPQPADRPVVRIIHPDVPQAEKWDPTYQVRDFNRMLGLTETSERPDLIVWPETAVTELLERSDPFFEVMSDTAQGVPLITGINRRQRDLIFHNSLIVLGRGGTIENIYDKRHLVPFGEYFPGGEIAERLGFYGLASSQGQGFTSGETDKTISIEGIGTIRPLICYEGIFAEEIGTGDVRPDMMILITNDGWFGTGAGPAQHLAQARLRAIEQGLPMVRAANRGISAILDPKGRVMAYLDLTGSGALQGPIPAALPPTLYARYGEAPFGALTVLLLAVCFLRRPDESD